MSSSSHTCSLRAHCQQLNTQLGSPACAQVLAACFLTCTVSPSALTSLHAAVPSPLAGSPGTIATEMPPASSSGRQPHEASSSSERHSAEQDAASTSSQWYAGEQGAARSGRHARDTGIRVAALPEEEAYRPTKEEFKRAVERSGMPESQKRKLLGARLPLDGTRHCVTRLGHQVRLREGAGVSCRVHAVAPRLGPDIVHAHAASGKACKKDVRKLRTASPVSALCLSQLRQVWSAEHIRGAAHSLDKEGA